MQGKGSIALFQSHHEDYTDDTCHVLVFKRGSWLFVLNVQTTCQIWAMDVFQMWQKGGRENMNDLVSFSNTVVGEERSRSDPESKGKGHCHFWSISHAMECRS